MIQSEHFEANPNKFGSSASIVSEILRLEILFTLGANPTTSEFVGSAHVPNPTTFEFT
jgi:hypothetical protein